MALIDTRRLGQSIEQRWPMKPEYREGVVRQLMQILLSPNSSAREKTSAARALIAAEAQNQEDEHKQVDVDDTRNRFLEIATRLGIGIGASRITEGGSSIDTSIVKQAASDR